MRRSPDRSSSSRRAGAWSELAEEPGSEFVLGAVGQPWRLRGGDSPAAHFATFDRPGYAKMAANWRFEGTTLSTETRVFLKKRKTKKPCKNHRASDVQVQQVSSHLRVLTARREAPLTLTAVDR